jgi:hypothetical protein
MEVPQLLDSHFGRVGGIPTAAYFYVLHIVSPVFELVAFLRGGLIMLLKRRIPQPKGYRKATERVYWGAAKGSYLSLPVVGAAP